MEYEKVQMLPHDPAMDPNESIPSYASSTGLPDRGDDPLLKGTNQQREQFTGRNETSSDD